MSTQIKRGITLLPYSVIMRYHHHRCARLSLLLKKCHDAIPIPGVKGGSGFISQNQARRTHQNPRERDALLLTTTQGIGLLIFSTGKPHSFQSIRNDARLPALRSSWRQCNGHVVRYGVDID